jgi:hypothetical protein
LTAGRPDVFGKQKLVFLTMDRFILLDRTFGSESTAPSGKDEAGIVHESDQVKEGHLVDALALRGDEGRGTLR